MADYSHDHHTPFLSPQVQKTFGDFSKRLLRALGRWAYMDWQKTLSSLIAFLLSLFGPFIEFVGVKLKDFLNNHCNGMYVTVGRTDWNGNVLGPGERVPQSVIGQMDWRVDLERNTKKRFPLLSTMARANADVCMMAAKLAYEDPPLVQDVVENLWNQGNNEGRFKVADYLIEKSTPNARTWLPVPDANRCSAARSDTNVYVFTRDHSPAQVACKGTAAVVVAFRGTEPFSPVDWTTDFSFEWLEIDGIGRVHMGFLHALGIGKGDYCSMTGSQFLDDFNRYIAAAAMAQGVEGVSAGQPGDGECQSELDEAGLTEMRESLIQRDHDGKIVGPLYFVLREKVLDMLNNNSDIKLFITGHSLGGALAALFTSLLVVDSPLAAKKLKALITFGQPRVGDLTFTWYLHHRVSNPELRYVRVLHCNDLVARVPFDDDLFQFKHLGPWFRSSAFCRIEMGAFNDQPKLGFFLAFASGIVQFFYALLRQCVDENFRETYVSLIVRFVGMFLPWIADHSPTNYVNAVRLGLPIDEGRGAPPGDPRASFRR